MNKITSVSRVLPVLFGFFIIGLVDLVGIATNYVKKDFTLSDTLANMLPITLFLWFAVLSVSIGMLINKLGRKQTVLLSMGISFAAMVMPLVSYNFAMVLAAFGLLGIGNTIIQVSLNPLLTDVVRSDRLTSSLTLGQFIKAIAAFLGSIIAGVAAGSFENWELVFLFFAVVTVVSGLWLALTPIPKKSAIQSSFSFTASFVLLKDRMVFMLFLGSHAHWVSFTPKYKDFLWGVENDSRAPVNISESTTSEGKYFSWINKYLGTWKEGTRIFDSDIRIYRYAEALLFKAEIEIARNNFPEALNYLNQIAKRDYKVDNYYSGTYT